MVYSGLAFSHGLPNRSQSSGSSICRITDHTCSIIQNTTCIYCTKSSAYFRANVGNMTLCLRAGHSSSPHQNTGEDRTGQYAPHSSRISPITWQCLTWGRLEARYTAQDRSFWGLLISCALTVVCADIRLKLGILLHCKWSPSLNTTSISPKPGNKNTSGVPSMPIETDYILQKGVGIPAGMDMGIGLIQFHQYGLGMGRTA